MKADPCGGYTEQIRARFGWKTKAELNAAGVDPLKTCGTCHHRVLKEIKTGDGSVNFSPYCWEPKSGDEGFATRESASCNKWERRS